MQNKSDEVNKNKTESQDTANIGKRAEESQHESEEKYRIILENNHYGCFEVDLAGNFTFFNDSVCLILGYSKEELMGMSHQHYTDKETAKIIFQAYNKVYNTGKPAEAFDWQIIRKDGFSIYVEESISLKKDLSGKPTGFRGIIRDITERKRAERALWQNEKRYINILKNMEEGYFEVDIACHYTFFNDSLCSILGYSKEELMGMSYQHYTDKETAKQVSQAFDEVYKTGEPLSGFDWEIIRKDGTKRYVEASASVLKDLSGKPIGFRGILRDITENKRKEAEIISLSITDQLTGLHNRRGFLSLAEQQLKLAERSKTEIQLFFADMDGLKWINDTLGHEEGDKALIETAAVLKDTFRASDIIARLGGDEFAILTIDTTEENVEIITPRLQSLIDARNNQEKRRFKLSISVGYSCYDPQNPCSMDELMASADKLMYEQKQKKKGLFPYGASLSNDNPQFYSLTEIVDL